MNLDEIEKKCFILSLFIRDDGERFLLGSRMFEFVDSQLHFSGNSYQNDIVEVQGNDGVMLAGQVRRGSLQSFDGYIGDSSVERHVIEQNRRAFFKFFRKNHYYKVVYIFTDGTAIQRRQGFIVEAPEVQELYQLFPQYHVSMNFEDINYYNYEEDSEGEEIYGESATLKIATSATGGLIWEDGSQITISGEGSNFTLNGTIDGSVLDSLSIKGDTDQQTYTGKNLLQNYATSTTSADVTITVNSDGTITANGTATGIANIVLMTQQQSIDFPAGTYTLWADQVPSPNGELRVETYRPSALSTRINTYTGARASNILTFTTTETLRFRVSLIFARSGDTVNNFTISELQLESGGTKTSYEPYVGGIPAPNPDYPQTVNTVTGRQVVTVSDGDSQSQEYEVNLGKNLFDFNQFYQNRSSFTLNNGDITITDSYMEYSNPSSADQYYNAHVAGNKSIYGMSNLAKSTTYTISYVATGDTACYMFFWNSSGTRTLVSKNISAGGGSFTFTTPADLSWYSVRIDNTSSTTNRINNIQIELGSTATTYAPYFTPIELCKIGTYQDYIYKSGNDWYVHKAVGKVELSTISAWGGSNGSFFKSGFVSTYGIKRDTLLSNIFVYDTTTWAGIGKCGITSTGNFWCMVDSSIANETSLRSLFSDKAAFLYGILTTSTDTQITNADLVAQLEALAGATTYNGQTVFTVSSLNQLAILNVSVIATTNGGVVWDEYGATWEEGTGGGPTMIDIESIDNVYPVWELTGPAVNPQISVLNTNTTLSYTGTITASQTLRIDMFNKTATLNGASVIGNVSGDWVYLEPGINRVTYTANNADASDSVIWWQEIVG